jgi:hypothetical protein
MNFEEYRVRVKETLRHVQEDEIIYPVLGLADGAGLVTGKIKHWLQGDELDRVEIARGLGDVLWNVAALASDLGISLDDIAEKNLQEAESDSEPF